MLLPFLWLMLLPLLMLADVVAMLADVIAILVADVIASFCCWQMLLPYLADVVAIFFFVY